MRPQGLERPLPRLHRFDHLLGRDLAEIDVRGCKIRVAELLLDDIDRRVLARQLAHRTPRIEVGFLRATGGEPSCQLGLQEEVANESQLDSTRRPAAQNPRSSTKLASDSIVVAVPVL